MNVFCVSFHKTNGVESPKNICAPFANPSRIWLNLEIGTQDFCVDLIMFIFTATHCLISREA